MTGNVKIWWQLVRSFVMICACSGWAASAAAQEPATPGEIAAPSATPAPIARPPATPAAAAVPEIPATAENRTTKPFTGVRGKLTDAKTGEALIEATVAVVRGAKGKKKTALSDVEGNYALALEPGEYDLRAYYEMYQGRKITGVTVRKGEATALDIQLTADSGAVQEVVVEAKADTRKEAAVLQERRRAATVQDAISAQEIARSPDSNASDAVKRVVSATVVDNKYLIVRGLGGRYTSVLLNQVVLPSPDPDDPSAPLDLFPAALLANMSVAKTYSPELPGNFAGGALRIETNSYPQAFDLKIKAGVAGDTASTFRKVASHEGGNGDYWGFGAGSRKLPDGVPSGEPARVSRNGLGLEEVEKIGESFARNWEATERRAMANPSVSAQAGDTLRVGAGKLGYLAAFSFSHKDTLREVSTAKVKMDGGEAQVREQGETDVATETGALGALANIGFEYGPHDINAFFLYTHTGDKKTQQASGFNETDNLPYKSTRLQFIERQLTFAQVRGRHRVDAAQKLEIRWQGNASWTSQREPDTRDVSFNEVEKAGETAFRLKTGPGSGERFFSVLKDRAAGGGLDLALPLSVVTLSAGGSAQHNSRIYGSRRFQLAFVGRELDDIEVLFKAPNDIFTAENIGPRFRIEERTQQPDAYQASRLVGAGYAVADIKAGADWRLIPGVRYEAAQQELTPGSPFAVNQEAPEGVDRGDGDVLPAFNTVYAISGQQNFRGAYSYTLARPQFRELAPFLYYDYTRRRSVSGNPALENTHIHNADLRWEWFPAENEVVSATGFYKKFADPIERVIVSASQGDVSFDNAAGAVAAGAELEARIGMERIAGALKGFRAGTNVTIVYSRVDLTAEQQGVQTSKERPLQGQSPYVVNFNAGWTSAPGNTDVTLLYNVYGKRIAEVGFDTLPDVYERPFHRLDLTANQKLGAGFTLKGTAANLLYQDIELEQGGISVHSYNPGFAMSASLEWSPK